MQPMTKYETVQNIANAISRAAGFGVCTELQFTHCENPKIYHTKYGYRKYSSGEYVPMAHLRNFGWKNTYYQSAEVTVFVPLYIVEIWASENLKKKRGW